MARPCSAHPQRPAISRCKACSAMMCTDCFRFLVSDAPSCAACAWSESNRERRRTSLAVTFVLLTWAIAFLLLQRGVELGLLVFAAVVAPVLAGAVWAMTRSAAPPAVREREVDEPIDEADAFVPAAHPYRARIRRRALSAAPKVSGTAVVLIVLASLGLCAVVAPAALRLPRWIEVEVGLAGFWMMLSGVLGVLLHRGYRLRDDFSFDAPWNRPKRASGGSGSSWGDLAPSGCDGCAADGEGFVVVLGLVLLLAVALLGAVLLVELIVPLAFLVTYAAIMKALATVAHDRHDCRGSWPRSAAWGATWGLVFTLPLAAIAFGLHVVLPGF